MVPRASPMPRPPFTAIEEDSKLDMDEEDVSPSLRPASRPDNQRSSTEPSPAVLLQGCHKQQDRPHSSSSHRNRSPYSRSHLRSRSSGSALLSAPLMTRAHSMPNPYIPRTGSAESSLSPSPQRSPARSRSPLKSQQQAEESIYNPPIRSPAWFENASSGGAIEAIQEDSELDLTPRVQLPQPIPMHSFPSRSSSLRRRPASPLHSIQATPTSSFPASVIDQNAPINLPFTSSGSSSPALGPQRYNEAYPSLHHYASSSSFSSIPSTPTSARSRSPSISSLDTIEDAPEMESEAEAEAIERLKLAAEGEEEGERRRGGSLDVPRGFGFGRNGGSRTNEKKRWSICGGERRGDLDLETIWED